MKQQLLSILFLLMGVVQSVCAQEPYAVLSEDNTTLTFYYDNQKEARSGMGVGPFEYNRGSVNSGWYENRATITTVVFDASFANCTSITSTAYWFYYCSSLSTITGIDNLKTDNVTDMSYMFNSCYSLTSLDVSGFKTDNVTNMRAMFSACTSLTSLDISNFNTANVTSMASMFSYMMKLTSLDLSHFNTAKVTHMNHMFHSTTITELNLSSFDTSNVTTMESMFRETQYTNLDLSNFNVEKVTNMSDMFYRCSNLVSLNLSSFNTASVKSMYEMFANCSALTTIYADEAKWSTVSVTSSFNIFGDCTALVGGNGTKYAETYGGVGYARVDKEGQPGYFTQKTSNVSIDAANFPDEALRNALLSQGFGADGVLSDAEIAAVTSLDLAGKGISNLTGISLFKALVELNISNNKIAGEAMDALVASLPTITAQAAPRRAASATGKLYVLDTAASNEKNAMTEEQAAAAITKGWQPYYNNGTEWVAFSGGIPSGIKKVIVGSDKSSPIYSLRGQRLSAPQKGINIINGKKVVVK